jgi:Leucine-rich repeat (LRR) protein
VRNSNFCKNESSVCQISSDIERLTSLEELSIFNTKVTHLPTSFGKLERLTILQLMSTDLVTLPNTFSNLQLLSSLTIYYSKMTSLPTAIGMISSLKTMYLDNNAALRSIQSLNGLQNLIILSAINCSITRIPLNLPNVSYAYMSNNKLTNLNSIQTLGSATNDNKLFAFEMNQISTLPTQIGSVYKLGALRVNGNKLTNLPSEIYGLKTLAYLDIRSNLFTATKLKEIVVKFKITNPSLMLLY